MNIYGKKSGLGREIPPLKSHVTIYFIQKGLTEKDANFFFQQQNLTGWGASEGRHRSNWKTLACDWIWEHQQSRRQRYRRHNY